MPLINKRVLVSGAEYFSDKDAINALMDASIPVNLEAAINEHQRLIEAFKSAGIDVVKIAAPKDLQDGIYVANWGLVRNGKVVPSRLPNKRQPEESVARKTFMELGLKILDLPASAKAFSGQGDSLAVDETVFCQSPYRTSVEAHSYIKDYLGYKQLISLQTKPARWFKFGPAKLNKLTGWPDSKTYDLDLALAIIKPKTDNSRALIAYCPQFFKRSSQRILKNLADFDKIVVSKSEALKAYATNLVSTGETVVMANGAPNFKAELISHGLKVIELDLVELKKGGGSIRCCSLTLD